jgi:uncharacterized protein (DUF1330 family)
MSAYVIVEIDVHDPVRYEDYKAMTPSSIFAFGGKFVVRGPKVLTLEGDWNPGRFVVLEFPSVERALEWWSSPEYAPAKALRQATANTQMILVDGVKSQPAT